MRVPLLCGLISMTFIEVVIECAVMNANVSYDARIEHSLSRYPEKRDEPRSTVLSRKRRYLTFPKGSAFTVTLSLLKSLLFTQTTPWNVVVEFDIIWAIPSLEQLKPEKSTKRRLFVKKNRNNSLRWRLRRRHKRDFYSSFETAFDSQGLPGRECMLRTICEARSFLSPPGFSFVEDLLRIILSNSARSRNEMDEYDLAYESEKECDSKYACPISILELLLSFDDNYT